MPKAGQKIKRGARLTGDARLELAASLRTKYENGATVRDLQYETGRSMGAVQRLLAESGVAMRPRGGSRSRG